MISPQLNISLTYTTYFYDFELGAGVKTSTVNWIPESYQEFRDAANAGLIKLNFMSHHYAWARSQIRNLSLLPRSKTKLRQDVLERMAFYEEFYLEAWKKKGIDLMLLEENVA